MKRLWRATSRRWRCGRGCRRPSLPPALCWRGMGRLKEAETRYRRALTLRPDFAAAWMNLGSLLREQGREVYAEAALLRAVELRPDLISGWVNLAILERERRRPAEAEAHLRKAFALNPEQVETLVAWCQFRAAEQDLAGAWEWLRWALARDPDHAEAVNMQGILLHNEGRFAEAVEVFERAEALGSTRRRLQPRQLAARSGPDGRGPAGARDGGRARSVASGRAYNLALTQLRLGDWERGWPGYEARWRFREVHRMPESLQPAALAGRGARRAGGFCSTPSRGWATPSSSAATRPWWRRAAACPSCRCRRRSSG